MASVTVFKNSDTTLQITVTSSGSAVDLSGYEMYFGMARTEGDTLIIEKKTVGAGGADTQILIDPDQVTNTGKADIFIDKADTTSLDCGHYTYDVWVLDTTSDRIPVVEPDTFILKEALTVIP